MRILLGAIAILTGVYLFCHIVCNLYVAPLIIAGVVYGASVTVLIFGEDDDGGEYDE